MPGLVALISAISDDVVAALAAAGKPPLVDGKIVIGRVKAEETSAPPRVIFTPRGSLFEPRSNPPNSSPRNPQNPQSPGSGVRSYTMSAEGTGYSPGTPVTIGPPDVAGGIQATATTVVTSNGAISAAVPAVAGSGYLNAPTVTIGGAGTGAAASSNLQPTPQALSVMTQRSIWTEWVIFSVTCWDVASPQSPDFDFDECQLLYQQVIASTHRKAAGVYRVNRGDWTGARAGTLQLDELGHEFVFQLQIATPLLDTPIIASAGAPVQLAPVNTQPNVTSLIINPSTGGPSQG